MSTNRNHLSKPEFQLSHKRQCSPQPSNFNKGDYLDSSLAVISTRSLGDDSHMLVEVECERVTGPMAQVFHDIKWYSLQQELQSHSDVDSMPFETLLTK